jgi:CheY-specific phosphatase CheX
MEPFVTDISEAECCRIQSGHLSEIASSLFSTMLALPFDTGCLTGCSDSGRQYEARIRVSGSWQAGIFVRASEVLARRIACVMFKLDEADLTEADVRDALGEVANVIGGGVKGIIDSDCDLSLPVVEIAASGQKCCSLFCTFECCSLPVSIAIVEAAAVGSTC